MSPEERKVPLCGDPTCESYGCTQEAIDAWYERQQADARALVYAYLRTWTTATP